MSDDEVGGILMDGDCMCNGRLNFDVNRNALDAACEILSGVTGSCPVDYGINGSENICMFDDCDNDISKCWSRHFLFIEMQKRENKDNGTL